MLHEEVDSPVVTESHSNSSGDATKSPHFEPAPNLAEVRSIGAELARAYNAQAQFYMQRLGLSTEKADAGARGLDMTPEQAARDIQMIRTRPPDQLSWADLQRVANRDPDELEALWAELKANAREELDTGHRAGQSMDWKGSPWERARYLAVRQSFHEGSPPQSGVEAALLDTAAEAYSDYLHLSEDLRRQLNATAEVERGDIERTERRVERAYKRLLQTIKMLHELQRASPRLYVTHANQVNIGQQQLNMAVDAGITASEPTDLPE